MHIGLREAEASQRIASFGPSAEMARAIWDRDFAAYWAPRSRSVAVVQVLFPEGIRGNDNDGRGGESRRLRQAHRRQRNS